MLTFGLKKIWFEKFLSGEKTHEYREVKPYWNKRLIKKVVSNKEDLKLIDFFINALELRPIFSDLNIACKLTLGQAPPKRDKDKRIFARIKSIKIINGLDSDLKVNKPVYDIELKLIGVKQ